MIKRRPSCVTGVQTCCVRHAPAGTPFPSRSAPLCDADAAQEADPSGTADGYTGAALYPRPGLRAVTVSPSTAPRDRAFRRAVRCAAPPPPVPPIRSLSRARAGDNLPSGGPSRYLSALRPMRLSMTSVEKVTSNKASGNQVR